jgi:hypothetical protein
LKNGLAGLSTAQRIEQATHAIIGVSRVVHFLMNIHETNQIVLYSDMLSRQIRKSHTANSYNDFTRVLLEIEIVRLCSLWDPPERDAFSIPTVVGLIDHDDVIEQIARQAGDGWRAINGNILFTDETDDEREQIRQAVAAYGERDAQREHEKISSLARGTIQDALSIRDSSMLTSVINFRNKHVAHATDITRLERKAGPVPLPKTGDESVLLEQTLKIVGNLDLCVRYVSFSWEDSKEIGRRNAEALWNGVTINVLR